MYQYADCADTFRMGRQLNTDVREVLAPIFVAQGWHTGSAAPLWKQLEKFCVSERGRPNTTDWWHHGERGHEMRFEALLHRHLVLSVYFIATNSMYGWQLLLDPALQQAAPEAQPNATPAPTADSSAGAVAEDYLYVPSAAAESGQPDEAQPQPQSPSSVAEPPADGARDTSDPLDAPAIPTYAVDISADDFVEEQARVERIRTIIGAAAAPPSKATPGTASGPDAPIRPGRWQRNLGEHEEPQTTPYKAAPRPSQAKAKGESGQPDEPEAKAMPVPPVQPKATGESGQPDEPKAKAAPKRGRGRSASLPVAKAMAAPALPQGMAAPKPPPARQRWHRSRSPMKVPKSPQAAPRAYRRRLLGLRPRQR